MAANKKIRIGPVALSNTLTTNIVNPTLTSAAGGVNVVCTQPYVILTHIRIVNKTAGPVSVSLWIGGTGGNSAGTEFAFQGTSVPANSYIDWYGNVRLDSADFLVGGASAATSLSFQAEGEIGFSG